MARGAARRPSGLQLSPTLSRHETRCSFRAIIASGQEPLVLPAAARILNAYAERWVRSMKEGCLSKVVLFGERSLRLALSEYVEHFHAERNLQTEACLAFPRETDILSGLMNRSRAKLVLAVRCNRYPFT
jgi:hypothetical protein